MEAEVFFITGEVSGDRHAAPVAQELLRRGYRVAGVGGPRMREVGVELLADSAGWGAVGVPDSARKFLPLLVRSRLLLRAIRRRRPAVVVLVDFGFFNTRMARHLRRMGGPPIFYYFPPGSWRQEPRDWSRLAALTDCIATPFASNAEHLRACGANAHWVGHPVLDRQPPQDRAAVRQQLRLAANGPLIALLPGSRAMERRILGPRMLKAAALIASQVPTAHFLWSGFPQLGALEQALQRRAHAAVNMTVVEDSQQLLVACDLALIAMGTATLEAAVTLTPMVTTYDGSTLAKWVAQKLLKQQQPFYAMPNILLGRAVVPEIVPASYRDAVTPRRLADAALKLLADPLLRAAMQRGLAQVRHMLGTPGAARRTADLIVSLLEAKKGEMTSR